MENQQTLTQELLEEAARVLKIDDNYELAMKLHLEKWDMPNFKDGTKELPIVIISSIASRLGIKIEKFYSKIFDTQSSGIGLLDLMKRSRKDKPFEVHFPEQGMDKVLYDTILKITSDLTKEALRDEECKAVYIAYINA